ncbi:MAG: hypothetical protein CMF69_04030 [Magnetovibrio sp.]|nr:hypothetical protein [Magnetovibrio sp.]
MRYPGTNGENIDFIVKDIIMSSSSGADLDWRVLWCGKRPYGADLHFPSFASLRRKWACLKAVSSWLHSETAALRGLEWFWIFTVFGIRSECRNLTRLEFIKLTID